MTRTNTISKWEDVLLTNEAVAVKKYFSYCLERKIEGIDTNPSSDEFLTFCKRRGLTYNKSVSEFFDYATKNRIRTSPSNFYEYTLRKEESGMFYDLMKEMMSDIKHDIRAFKSFTKKDWLEALAFIALFGIGLLNTILLILAF